MHQSNKCTCHICTTSVADLLTEIFLSYLLGDITTDEYAEITEELKRQAYLQVRENRMKRRCNEMYAL